MKHLYKMSICMMVRDEEENIARCLNSLFPLIENGLAELIVIDTGSKDATAEIVSKYTDKLFFHNWNDNFSDMRNISISYAKGEWIFIIDADERLDNPQGIIDIFKRMDIEKYNTIQLYVKNLYSINNENNYNRNISPRIFKNDGSFCYQGSVHNQPIMKEPFLNVDISLTHFGYISSDKELMEKKFTRTVTLLKKELQSNPKDIYYLYQLGVSYDMHGDHKEALVELRKAYKLLKKEPINIRKNYINIYGSYIRVAYRNQEYHEVNTVGEEAIKLNREYIDIYYILSLTAKQINNHNALIQNCLEYDKLYNTYSSLDIFNNYAVIMYHIDEHSSNFIYSELSLHFLKENQLDTAYEYANKVTIKTQKDFLMIKILIKKLDFLSLKNYYLNEIEAEDSFLATLEEEIKTLPEEKTIELYKEFCNVENSYGALCEFRLYSNNENIDEYLKYFDFKQLPIFYAEVLLKLKGNIKKLLTILKPLSIPKARNIINYLINRDIEFIIVFEEYLKTENIRLNDMQSNKVYIAIAAIMLIHNADNKKEINKTYYNFFKSYLDRGINYVSQLYQIHKARVIYNDVVNDEDRFFILMYVTNDNIQKNNIKHAIKYLTEAVKSYKFMAKYVELFKNDLLTMLDENYLIHTNEENINE